MKSGSTVPVRRCYYQTDIRGVAKRMNFTISIVDDDAGVLRALSRRLRVRGYNVLAFSSPRAFLAQHDVTAPGCAVLDVSMPDLDGLELQAALTADGSHRPIIFISGKGDVPTSVRAMKAGAVDFLMKPISDEDLLKAIALAEQRDGERLRIRTEVASIEASIAELTPREREVLVQVVAGRLNKQIAGDLGTVEQTIKVHRRRMMRKLGARNMVELMHIMAKVPQSAK